MKHLVILPTYNEALNIEDVIRKTKASLPDCSILVIDDGSPDGTASIAEKLGEEFTGIEVMKRKEKSGLGNAYKTGFKWGLENGFDVMVEMDSDLSHDPAALPSIVVPMDNGFDLVVGSRYIPGGKIPNWSLPRRLLSRYGNVYAEKMLKLPIKDATAGYRAYSARILQQLDFSKIIANGYGFQIEMTYRSMQKGAKITEVPITFVDRERGTSKMSIKIPIEALLLVTKWSTERLRRKPTY